MSAPAISFYAGTPSTVCSAQQSCSISSHGSPSDYDPNPRGAPQKPIAGGLSCLFSSPSVLHASSCFSVDDVGALRRDKSAEEIGCSYSSNTKPREHHSPVSVLQGPARSSPSYGISRDIGESKWGRDRLFRGFVRNALGPSCLEYDAPAIATGAVDGQRDPEEFTFNMEDEFDEEESNCEPYAMEMLSGLQSRHKIFREEFVVRAFHEAERAHRGQVRASGDPYLQHCADTAVLLVDIGANAIVVAAGLLHDTMDDSFLTYDSIFKSFGAEVAELVEGVSKLSQLSKLARENNTANKSVEADRLHTMYLAMGDARAVLIKLADRLHNMLTLDALPLPKQQRFAKETLEIFVPMANRLGIFNWKEQLENLCFKYLYPEQHKELSTQLAKSFDEAMVANAKCELEEVLKAEGVCYHVLHGRHKSLYSIYSKMLKKNASMREIHDITGLRLIVESEDDCYRALDIVHKLWTKVPGRHKDYIARPKFNGYQSLHTVVQSKDRHPLEVQIRTKEMHRHAEFGFAAHWRYKEGLRRDSSSVLQVVEWARWVLTWQCETMFKDCHVSLRDTVSTRPPCSFPFHSEDCPYNYRPQNDEDPIFVILLENDMMSVQEFPANSTLSDLMERVGPAGTAQWTTHGFPLKEELRPRVNSTPAADLDQKLKMGDVIELTPAIPDKALTEYREEIQRMFERGMAVSTADYW